MYLILIDIFTALICLVKSLVEFYIYELILVEFHKHLNILSTKSTETTEFITDFCKYLKRFREAGEFSKLLQNFRI